MQGSDVILINAHLHLFARYFCKCSGMSGARRSEAASMEAREAASGDMDREERLEFRHFVKAMRFNRSRTVEMRFGLLASIAIGLRVFYSNLIGSGTAYSIFLFMLCE